jgi:hypothetical protein
VARLSVTLDEDVAAWVQEEAQRRGVSKAKVLRDCVTIAMETGTSNAHNTDHDTRFDDLEARVAALEAAVDDVPSHENETASDSSSDAPTDASAEDVQAHLERVLADRPPATPHGQAAVITTALLLREHGSMQTQDLQNAVYECHVAVAVDSTIPGGCPRHRKARAWRVGLCR